MLDRHQNYRTFLQILLDTAADIPLLKVSNKDFQSRLDTLNIKTNGHHYHFSLVKSTRYMNVIKTSGEKKSSIYWRANEANETLSGVYKFELLQYNVYMWMYVSHNSACTMYAMREEFSELAYFGKSKCGWS